MKVPEFLKSKGWFDENIDDDFLNLEDPYKQVHPVSLRHTLRQRR